MVLIINGEVIADTDPRAIARRNRESGTGSSGSSRQRFGSLRGDDTINRTASSSSRGTTGSGEGGIVSSLEKALGVEGKTFEFPAMFGNPTVTVPVVVFFVLSALCLLTSWRVALGALLLIYIYYLQQEQN